MYLGLLPYTAKDGCMILPTGVWYGWYFSEELKFAVKNGYKIHILYGYNWSKAENVFNNYVKFLYFWKKNLFFIDLINY
jgi:hypothetical protein